MSSNVPRYTEAAERGPVGQVESVSKFLVSVQ